MDFNLPPMLLAADKQLPVAEKNRIVIILIPLPFYLTAIFYMIVYINLLHKANTGCG